MRFGAFDTAVDIEAFGDAQVVQRALERAREMCVVYERLFSRTLEGSDIWRLNHAEGEAVQVDARTAQVLMAALDYCEASDGAFDITVGKLCGMWDFKRGGQPDAAALAAACEHVDFRKLKVWVMCGGSWFAQLEDAQAQVDLGGIAKGWIADALGAALLRAGATGALVNLGGNVLAVGSKPNGQPWRIGVKLPTTRNAACSNNANIVSCDIRRASSVAGNTTCARSKCDNGMQQLPYFEHNGQPHDMTADAPPSHPGVLALLPDSPIIAHEAADDALALVVELEQGAVVTSGVYERCFQLPDGSLAHHILNPHTGQPVKTDVQSVSIVAKRAIDAEGFSTTFLALGPDRSRTIAHEHPEVLQAFFIQPRFL